MLLPFFWKSVLPKLRVCYFSDFFYWGPVVLSPYISIGPPNYCKFLNFSFCYVFLRTSDFLLAEFYSAIPEVVLNSTFRFLDCPLLLCLSPLEAFFCCYSFFYIWIKFWTIALVILSFYAIYDLYFSFSLDVKLLMFMFVLIGRTIFLPGNCLFKTGEWPYSFVWLIWLVIESFDERATNLR